MKNLPKKIIPQYIIDKAGKKTAVILDIKTFNKMLDRIEDLYLTNMANNVIKKEKIYTPHEKIVKKIRSKNKHAF